MKRVICETEEQTSTAMRSGTVSPEIASHARLCAPCSEILLLGEFLQANDTLTDRERTALPDPGLIWQTARAKATQEAVRAALRPIAFMKIVACVAFASSPWLHWSLPIWKELLASCSKAFDLNLVFVSKPWPATASEITLLVGFSGTIVVLGLSSWYMLRQE